MSNVFNDLCIAAGWLRVIGAGSQRGRGCEPCSFLSHSFHFAFLCLRELSCNNNETEVDHEKRSDLKLIKLGKP